MKKLFIIFIFCLSFMGCSGKFYHSSIQSYKVDPIPGYSVQMYVCDGSDPMNPKDIHDALNKYEIPWDYVYYINGYYMVFKRNEIPE